MQHLKTAFEGLYNQQQIVISRHPLPEAVLKTGGKISRGENYLGLPWLVLDYPRHFTKDHIFAVRTLFWWGRFFSTTLHISGNWQQITAPKLVNAWARLQQHPVKIACDGDQWVHNLNDPIYKSIQNISKEKFEKIIKTAPFIKIAFYTGIENVESAPEILIQQFELITHIIGDAS